MKGNTIAIAIAAMLVGGVAVGAYHNNRAPDAAVDAQQQPIAVEGDAAVPEQDTAVQPETDLLEYARVLNVKPVTETAPLYATVLGSEPVRETSTTMTPREVCEDVVVQERLPERDGNVGGTVAGALIGGLLGNPGGGGKGRRVATAAGAAAGGLIGNRVDRNHVGGRVVERVESQCHTVQAPSQSSQVVAYNVTYRNPDGTTGTLRTGSRPGERIKLGEQERTIAYDVTYTYDGSEATIRMDEQPGERLPVLNGRVMAAVGEDASTQQ